MNGSLTILFPHAGELIEVIVRFVDDAATDVSVRTQHAGALTTAVFELPAESIHVTRQ